MNAKEWLESKEFVIAGAKRGPLVERNDALIAIELAEMQGSLEVYKSLEMEYHIQGQQKAIDRFKQKHNIQ